MLEYWAAYVDRHPELHRKYDTKLLRDVLPIDILANENFEKKEQIIKKVGILENNNIVYSISTS